VPGSSVAIQIGFFGQNLCSCPQDWRTEATHEFLIVTGSQEATSSRPRGKVEPTSVNQARSECRPSVNEEP
jgi:hypothetical protein